jgi:predicted nucleotidyltransferase
MKKKIPNKINIALEKLIQGIQEIFGNNAKKIILYGSYARGDFNKHSDVDIMILTDIPETELYEYKDKIWDYAYDIDLEEDVLLSVLVKNIETYNKWLDYNLFYMNVQNEGVVLSEN